MNAVRPSGSKPRGVTLVELVFAMVTVAVVGVVGAIGIAASIGPGAAPHTKHPAHTAAPAKIASKSAAHASVSVPWGMIGLGAAALLVAVGLAVAGTVAVKRVRRARRAHRDARTQWASLLTQHTELETRWLSYEKDLRLLVQFPVMRDMADPLVQDTVQAMMAASALRAPTPPAGPVDESGFAAAVAKFRRALDAAEQHARKVRSSKFSQAERITLRRVQALLDRAMDEGNFVPERQAAYRQALKLLEGVIVVPPSAVRAMLAAHPILALEAAKAAPDPLLSAAGLALASPEPAMNMAASFGASR